jgi:hypothetical protein
MLCPNEPQGKEIRETISHCRKGLLPLSAQSRFRRKENSSPSATSKTLFQDLVPQGEFEAG